MPRRTPSQLQPRLLDAETAAAYFSLPVQTFRRLRIGEVILGKCTLYDRHAMDAHLDQLAGLSPQSPPLPADNDPEAAFDRSAPDFRGHARGS